MINICNNNNRKCPLCDEGLSSINAAYKTDDTDTLDICPSCGVIEPEKLNNSHTEKEA